MKTGGTSPYWLFVKGNKTKYVQRGKERKSANSKEVGVVWFPPPFAMVQYPAPQPISPRYSQQEKQPPAVAQVFPATGCGEPQCGVSIRGREPNNPVVH